MSDEAIAPALTAHDWELVAEDRAERSGSDSGMESGPLTGIAIGYTNGALPSGRLSNPYAPAVLIALINDAIPDDSPYKFTRADVATLDRAAELAFGMSDDEDVALQMHAELSLLAHRVRALLPPRTTGPRLGVALPPRETPGAP